MTARGKMTVPRTGWRCPACGRMFGNRNQPHSCERHAIDAVLDRVPVDIQEICFRIIGTVRAFGPMEIHATRMAIMLKAPSTFAAIKPRRDRVELEFLLSAAWERGPVYRTVRVSTNRVAHCVRLEHARGVTQSLLSLLRRSYRLISGR